MTDIYGDALETMLERSITLQTEKRSDEDGGE